MGQTQHLKANIWKVVHATAGRIGPLMFDWWMLFFPLMSTYQTLIEQLNVKVRHILISPAGVDVWIYLSSSQVAGGSSVSSSVAPQWSVVLRYVEPQAEEDVVPDEHLHMRRLTGVYRHDVTVDHGHSTLCCSGYKVTVGLGRLI